MNELILTKVLAFAALGLVLGVLCVSLLLLFQARKKGGPLLYLGLSALTGYALMNVILRLSLGIMCYLPAWQIELLYGGVIALQVYYLQDVIRQLCALYACGKEGGGHDR